MMSATLDVESLRDLVQDAQRGDRQAAEQLIRSHDSWVRSIIFGVTGRADMVDDIAQQVWMQAWERLDSLQEPQRLRSWLYAIARHAAIDAGMARKRRAEAAGLPDHMLDSRVTGPAQNPLYQAAGNELHAVLLRAVESLPMIYREPFVLRHLEDWSYAEIGDVLGLPVETVETRLVRARRLLREMLTGKVEGE